MQLMNIASQVDELLRPWPAPFSYAYSRLVKALARAGHDVLELDRMRLRVAGLREPVSLMEALLQQVTGLQPLPRDPERIEAGLHLLDTPDLNPPKPLSGSELINVMDQAAAGFPGVCQSAPCVFLYSGPTAEGRTLIDRLYPRGWRCYGPIAADAIGQPAFSGGLQRCWARCQASR